jgi:hypothetical protein
MWSGFCLTTSILMVGGGGDPNSGDGSGEELPMYESKPVSKILTNKLGGLSQRADYTDRATAACRRS